MEEKKEINEQNQENIENIEKANNKKNVFNIIIGISTLLIALLGATFAYFSATARSEDDAVSVKSAFISINYDGGTELKAQNLIPSKLSVVLNKYQKEIADEDIILPTDNSYDENAFINIEDEYEVTDEENKKRRCIDANGRQVCYVYRFGIKSDGEDNANTPVRGGIIVSQNDFDNLRYIVYKVSYKTEGETILRDKWGSAVVDSNAGYITTKAYSVSGNDQVGRFNIPDSEVTDIKYAKFPKPIDIQQNSEGENTEDGNYNGTDQPYACLFGYVEGYDGTPTNDIKKCATEDITNDGKYHYYEVVVWLNETGNLQNEQNKEFKGTVSLEVANNESDKQITGE